MAFWHLFYRRGLAFLLALVFALLLASCSRGGDGDAGSNTGPAVLSWVAPTQREDSSALSLADIAGYRVYYSDTSGVYSEVIAINNPTSTQTSFTGVPSGTYYVILTTVDSEGRESGSSPEVVVKL